MDAKFRSDLSQALDTAWSLIGEPGTWWTGEERVAIAAEARQAPRCALCRVRREATSAAMASGEHDSAVDLPPSAIEAIHRIRTDPGRLGPNWYQSLLTGGLSDERYVELLAVIAIVVAVDTFRRAAGLPMLSLPNPKPGEPSCRRPHGARPGLAWMPTLAPEDRAADDP